MRRDFFGDELRFLGDEMLSIAICDDEELQRDVLCGLVSEWAVKNNKAAGLNSYPSAEAFLFAYEDNKSVDILLLDIQMGKINGVDLAKKIRRENSCVQIIFATGYMEYISDGYDVDALHYLIKPVSKEKLFSVLDKAAVKLAQAEKVLWVQVDGINTRIPLYEIRLVEVLGNYATIYANKEFRIKKTLSAIEPQLDENFFRVGRSFIVNLRHVRQIGKKEAVLEGGHKVPLPRGMYERLNRAIINN